MKRYLIAALIVLACSAGGLRADDTEIYGVINNTSVAPNVLIIFDTSGSMADTIPGEPYDSATTYAGSYIDECRLLSRIGTATTINGCCLPATSTSWPALPSSPLC